MQSLYRRIITPLAQFGRTRHWLVAGALLILMGGLGVCSMYGDSAIVDEIAHIPSAYSYLHYGDMRLNPEHPPLIKDLAGLPLQFMNLKFPVDQVSWTTDVNGQWESGWNFIYHIGNNADQVVFWARLPILLLALAFGIVLYRFVRGRWGIGAALLTLFFYTLSPNILAHSRFVTTDLGATVFIFLALVMFVKFMEQPTRRNILLLSLALGVANLAKFNAILLFPFLGLITLVAVVLWSRPAGWWNRAKTYVGGFLLACVTSVLWIWLYYIPHTINMPEAVQDRLITVSLPGDSTQAIAQALVNINGVEILKPLVQYVLGLTMVFNRVDGGNTTYFMGQVTNQSFHGYFPVLFLLKTQIALLILMVVGLAYLLAQLFRPKRYRLLQTIRNHLHEHLMEWTIGGFALFYFAISVAGNLNLGIRHVLPVYVPLFVLVALVTVIMMRRLVRLRRGGLGAVVLGGLLVWYGGSMVMNHPAHTSYFNEIIGGPANAGEYFSDSSVDWGQDLRRLKTYVDAHPEIDHFALDYFGGGDPQYYFCKRKYDEKGQLIASSAGYDCADSKFEGWHSEYGRYTGQYIAVSETFLENDRYYSAKRGESGYSYLRAMTPIAQIGYSIYIYKLY